MRSIYSSVLFLALSIQLHAQFVKSVTIKTGPVFSGQTFGNGSVINSIDINGNLLGFSASIEPTFVSFGAKKRFDFSTDLSFIQKGAINYGASVYDDRAYGRIQGTGSDGYPLRINYISVSPLIKFKFAKILFLKAGPRADVFTSFNSTSVYYTEKRTNKDFAPVTFGFTYGAGICAGKKRTKFVCEFIGQQDLTRSYNRSTLQSNKNYAFLLSFGADITLGKVQ